MKEKTGVQEIDEVITHFLTRGHPELNSGTEGILWLQDPWEAEGECSYVSCLFAQILVERGIRAYDSGRKVKEADYPFLRNPLLGSSHSPDDFGYQDRLREPEAHPEHSATICESERGDIFLIDWTAAQYGYSFFPFVQKRQGNIWLRDF
jgi:hypothetical protein